MGSAGDRAFASLGAEAIDWVMSGADLGDPPTERRRLRQLGPDALPKLIGYLGRACARSETRAIDFVEKIGDSIAVPPLTEIAGSGTCPNVVRARAARAVGTLDPPRGARVLRQLLGERALTDEHAALAADLIRTEGITSLPVVTDVLRNGDVPRAARWQLSEALRVTGHPDALAAADRYGPSGRRGSSDPGWAGAWLTAGLLATAGWLLIRWEGSPPSLGRTRRLATVTAALVGAHFGVFLIFNFALSVGFLMGSVPAAVVMIVPPFLCALAPILVSRDPGHVSRVYATLVALVAVLGIWLGAFVDSAMCGVERRSGLDGPLAYFSHLEVAIAFVLTLWASYGPRYPPAERSPR